MPPIKPKATKAPKVEVELVDEPTTQLPTYSDEQLFVVKLDTKKFEGRTLEQALKLIEGSVGVVSKVTMERQ